MTHARDVFMSPRIATTRASVCYGDHVCGAEEQTYNNAEVPEEGGGGKMRGISFTVDLATAAERSGEVESRPNKKRWWWGGGGVLHASSCEGALLDLDDCTRAAAVRQEEGAICDELRLQVPSSEERAPSSPSLAQTHTRCSARLRSSPDSFVA